MPRRDLALAMVVMLFWGANFVVIDVGLETVPPLLFAAIRYAVVALPALFLVPRPAMPWRHIALVGTFLSAGQMGLLYLGLHEGMPAGLASLICQLQMVFTIAVAVALLRERPAPRQLLGAAVALAGIVVIAVDRGGAGVPALAFVFCIGAAASWGVGNVITRVVRAPSAIGLLTWSSLVPPLPLAALSLAVDGPHAVGHAFAHWGVGATLSTLYTVALCTWFGYGAWTWLLSRHPASHVAPFALLVPPVGLVTAWIARGEVPTPVELAGAAVVLVGLALLSLALGAPVRHGAATAAQAATSPTTP
jgi:O-acetylserine/cysteine efflux transporter